LLVRKLEPELVEHLKRQARAHGRSVEAEHRAILQAALQPNLGGQELFELLRRREVARGRRAR
jgi:plasmid stability protein